ncbi:MAG: hypothetical protein ABR579_07870 [Actinomycetota bacterium]
MKWDDYDLDARDVATLLSGARVALGALLFLMPTKTAKAWSSQGADSPAAIVASRGMGGRDFVLGLGALLALGNDKPVRGWIEAAALSDLLDAINAALSFRKLPPIRALLMGGSAAGAAILGMQLAPELDG